MSPNPVPFPPNVFRIDLSHFPPTFSRKRKCHRNKKTEIIISLFQLPECPDLEMVKTTNRKPMQEYVEQSLNS